MTGGAAGGAVAAGAGVGRWLGNSDRCRRRRATGVDEPQHVLSRYAPGVTGTRDASEVDAVLARQPADGRCHSTLVDGDRGAVGSRVRQRDGRSRPPFRSPPRGARRHRLADTQLVLDSATTGRGASGAPPWSAAIGAAAAPLPAPVPRVGAAWRRFGGLDHGDLGVVGHRVAFLDKDLGKRPGEGRRDLRVDLVGDDLDDRLVPVDVLADLLEPLADRSLGHALAELRHRHFRHWVTSGPLRRAWCFGACLAHSFAHRRADRLRTMPRDGSAGVAGRLSTSSQHGRPRSA